MSPLARAAGLLATIAALGLPPGAATVSAAGDEAPHGIQGPERVGEGEPFDLCALDDAVAWSWHGAGFRSSIRCLELPGLPPGLYEFRLTVRLENGSLRRWRHKVTVEDADDAAALCDASPAR